MTAHVRGGVLVACYLVALGATQYTSCLLEIFRSHALSSLPDHRHDTRLDYVKIQFH